MKRILLLLCMSLLFLLTGCWDELPIDERGFVLGSGIDMADEGGDEQGPSLTFTNQFVVPSAMANPGQGGSTTDREAYTNLSATGESSYIISREMQSLIDWVVNYEHLKVIAISNKIAKDPSMFPIVVDSFIRNQEIRRGIRVVITSGEAKELFDTETETKDIPALFIETILNNNVRSLELIEPVRIGQLHRYLLNNNSYLMPQLTVENGTIRYDSVAVFDGSSDQKIGVLTGDSIKGFNFLKGNMTKGAISFQINDALMIYEVKKTNSSIKVEKDKQNHVNISVKIKTEGNIAEMFGSESLVDTAYMNKIEEKIAEKIKQMVNDTVAEAQEGFETDFLGLGEKVKEQQYDTWKKVKDDWENGDQLFSRIAVDVSVESFVRSIGASDQAKENGKE